MSPWLVGFQAEVPFEIITHVIHGLSLVPLGHAMLFA